MAEEVKKAGRPATKKEEPIVSNNTNDDVMALLKQMQSELASLKKENETLKASGTSNNVEILNGDAEVEVMDLFAGSLTLYTEGFGQGTKYPFPDGFGEVIDIPLSDLKLIVKNNSEIAKSGYFYIMNEEAVNICRLKKAYESLLSPEQMEKLSSATADTVVALYNSAPKSQKEIIIEYFASKKSNGERVDHNILYQLGELSGRKLTD